MRRSRRRSSSGTGAILGVLLLIAIFCAAIQTLWPVALIAGAGYLAYRRVVKAPWAKGDTRATLLGAGVPFLALLLHGAGVGTPTTAPTPTAPVATPRAIVATPAPLSPARKAQRQAQAKAEAKEEARERARAEKESAHLRQQEAERRVAQQEAEAAVRAQRQREEAVRRDTAPSSGGGRTGAVCNDGSYSTATGRGACSHHGGVDHWLYN